MNMHVPQAEVASAELKHIMSVKYNILNGENAKAMIAPIQDSLVGIFIMTSRTTLLSKEEFFNLLIRCKYSDKNFAESTRPAIQSPEPMFTGKQAISFTFPKNLS